MNNVAEEENYYIIIIIIKNSNIKLRGRPQNKEIPLVDNTWHFQAAHNDQELL